MRRASALTIAALAASGCSLVLGLERGYVAGPSDAAADAEPSVDTGAEEAGAYPDCPACTRLADSVGATSDLVANGDSVYWVDGQTIRVCSRNGCITPATVVTAPGPILFLRYSARRLLWYSPKEFGFVSLGLSETTPTLHRTINGLPTGLALEEDTLFWSEMDRRVRRCPLSGCGSSTITLTTATALPQYLFSENGYVVWAESGFRLSGCANAKAAANCGGSVTGAPAFIEGQPEPAALAADASSLFWVTASGELDAIPFALGPPYPAPRVLATGLVGAARLVADGDALYVQTQNRIVRVPKAGGAPDDMVKNMPGLTGMALDDTYVFGAESTRGTVFRLPRR